MGDAGHVDEQGDVQERDDAAGFRSELVLADGWWRQFVREVVALIWSSATIAASWVVWWRWDRATELLVVALLLSGWCVYVAASWLRSLRRRLAVMRSGIPTLVMDDLGVRVRHPFGNLDGAYLAWTDCVAVVVSRPPTAGRVPDAFRAYVEFVPVAPDRVDGVPRPDQRTVVLERPPVDVRTTWLELAGVGRPAGEVVAWIRQHRPYLKVVDSLARQSASTL